MNSKKAVFAILSGVALTTAVGILLTPYRKSSRRKRLINKARGYTDAAEETIIDSVADANYRFKRSG